MTRTQKAFFIDKKFGDFIVATTRVLKPGPGEVLIKVLSASLNPVDWKIQKHDIFVESYPAILGSDVAGDIEEVGEGVVEFKKGDRVFCQGQFNNRGASFQQYALAFASTIAMIPPKITYDEAAALPVAVTATYVGLYHPNPLYGFGFESPITESARGKYVGVPLLILGGASSVGQTTIQFARLSGFSPIITTASLKHTSLLKALGATHVLDRYLDTPSLVVEIRKITNNEPVKFVYDAVSFDDTQQAGLDIVASGGKLAVVLPITVQQPEDKQVIFFLGILRIDYNIKFLEEFYHNHMSEFLERGWVKPNKVEILPDGLVGIFDGLARLKADQVSGLKLIARPHETPQEAGCIQMKNVKSNPPTVLNTEYLLRIGTPSQ